MARDYYDEARGLAAEIRTGAAELVRSADRIEDAITSGFTATEILMGLRFRIGEMLDNERASLPDGLRARAAELAQAIDETLRS
ncbi:MAG: hypothetical protein GY745_22170 [Actinomycetia bacterium]|nr:hypothetical protein [Actinomycetes bacterium]MCP4087726.1 hypothetical protein [Actinomycetes bacterium]